MSVELPHLQAVLRLMERFVHPWWLVGGWSLDLLAGEVTRDHHDIEVSIFRKNQFSLRSLLADFETLTCLDERWVPWRKGIAVGPPMFQVKACRRVGVRVDPWLPNEFEFFLNDARDDRWFYRRDWRVSLPLSRLVVRSRTGVPCLRPEVVFLYKAKALRPQDEADFERHSRLLDTESRAWLKEALQLTFDGHPWIERL
ncbi:MAG: hypothetical protein QM770_03130 [Tepidisphaeraceae bacterium]